LSVAAYIMLFLLGAMQGVVGCFHYGTRPVPLDAIGFDLLLLVTCLLAGSGMRRPAGGLMPAVGWFAASFVLSMGTKGGSVVITNSSAGKWFLFGGSACAAAGVLVAFARWSRPAGSRAAVHGPAVHGPAGSAAADSGAAGSGASGTGSGGGRARRKTGQ
jgi:hypothetical protein